MKEGTCFAKFRREIPIILKQMGELRTNQLYERIRERIPECISSELIHTEGRTDEYRWYHQIREAQQYLRLYGEIERKGNKWSVVISAKTSDEIEQDEICSLLKEKDLEEISKELRSLSNKTPEIVEYNGKRYKRDNATIAKLKIFRNFKCQICNEQIKRKDGTFYIEAAHITEKKNEGQELPYNLMILCPNHHKEFDIGNRIILERANEYVSFELNGQLYKIDLSV